jgi:hypothetical protein
MPFRSFIVPAQNSTIFDAFSQVASAQSSGDNLQMDVAVTVNNNNN